MGCRQLKILTVLIYLQLIEDKLQQNATRFIDRFWKLICGMQDSSRVLQHHLLAATLSTCDNLCTLHEGRLPISASRVTW